jgi:N-methylhydantoinase A
VPSDAQLRRAGRRDAAARTGPRSRPAYFEPGGLAETPVIDRPELSAEPRPGPLIVEEYDATTVVPPGCSARLDEWGNIVLDVSPV